MVARLTMILYRFRLSRRLTPACAPQANQVGVSNT
jgi:hypothetical protein